MLDIKLNKKQRKIISTLEMDRLERSVLIVITYTDKSDIELYKILVTIYNNPNNHNQINKLSSQSNGINTIRYNSFNNFTPRSYDYDSLEKKLLGWEN